MHILGCRKKSLYCQGSFVAAKIQQMFVLRVFQCYCRLYQQTDLGYALFCVEEVFLRQINLFFFFYCMRCLSKRCTAAASPFSCETSRAFVLFTVGVFFPLRQNSRLKKIKQVTDKIRGTQTAAAGPRYRRTKLFYSFISFRRSSFSGRQQS